MMTVLPDGLHNNEGSLWRNLLEDFDAVALAMDKPVPLHGVKGMATPNKVAQFTNCGDDNLFYLLLSRPTGLICRKTKITTSNVNDFRILHGPTSYEN